jgi:phenylpropionate dioxygenase-like ring-hydroxylating dioxygenase large terminal subunit
MALELSLSGEVGIDAVAVEEALARNMTFPARWYSDPAIYDFELERIFTRSWQFAGPLAKLREPGDHIVCQVGHVPVLVARGRDRQLHGMVNVCRHRAYPVAVCDGHRMTFQCRYHAWTYELDGRLHKAPRAEREACFDPAEYSLLPVSVDTWGELVFVNPDPQAPSLRDSFPEFDRLADERGVDFSAYRYHGRFDYEIAANWKVWVENASECYHCPTVHAQSFSDAFIDDADVYQYIDGQRVLGQFTHYNPRARSYRHPVREGDREFRYIYLWPATTLVQDDLVAFPGVIVPTGPESCRFIADMYVHPDCDEQTAAQWTAMWNRTLEEDVDAVRLQQPGLRSRMVPHGRLMPASESAIARFHRMVWEAFQEALSPAAG